MKDRFNIRLISIIAVVLIIMFVIYSDLVTGITNAEGNVETATDTDAIIVGSGTDALVAGETIPIGERRFLDLNDDPDMSLEYGEDNPTLIAASTAYPDYRPVGDMHPMSNDADWWSDSKDYITSTFGVVDGVYNTTANAPAAGSVWCAGLVSRVIHYNYPNGDKIGVTESVATLYNSITSSGSFEYIAEGYVGDFIDVIGKLKAGDIMLLMSQNSSGSWVWSHSNLITYYGYIYSQGAGGKIRMNTFDNYNQYGAYDPVLSAGYYYYIYRPVSNSYLALKKVGLDSGDGYDNVWFEAYDTNGTYLGAYLTGAAKEEKGGYAFYLRKSEDDLSYVESDGAIPLPAGSTVYLYEQGVKSGSSYVLPEGASDYAGIKGQSWDKVKGPQKEYYVTAKTVSSGKWKAQDAYVIDEPEESIEGEITDLEGQISLKKKVKNEYSMYAQDPERFSLEGARYKIESEDGEYKYELETGSDGVAYVVDEKGNRTRESVITGLAAGKYFCWETKASKGYLIDQDCCEKNKKSIELKSDDDKGAFESQEIPDVKLRGGIQLIKRSSQKYTAGNKNYDLSAEYTVYDSSGSVAGVISMSEQGSGYLGGLQAGKYTVKETKAGKGFKLDPKVYEVTVSVPTIGTYVYNGIDYSAVFEPGYYKSKYSDLSSMNNDALLRHFAEHGLKEGRRANACYDSSYYSKLKGLSNFEAFKYYLGYGIYRNEKTSSDDYLNVVEVAGVYQNSTSKPVVISYEEPYNYDKGIRVEKYDKYTGSVSIEGEAELEGAEFEISYYNRDTLDGIEQCEADERWIIKAVLNDEGKIEARFEEGFLSQDVEQSAVELNEAGQVIIPFGVIKIEEITPPKGYTLRDTVYEIGDKKSTEPEYILLNENSGFDGNVKVYETVIRGDLKLEKHSYSDDKPMQGVEFEVKSDKTGESLVIVTDENGFASTTGMWLGCSADGEAVDKQEGEGALPYGSYTVSELRCDANKDKQLEPPIKIMVEDEMIYDVFDPTNNEPIIRNVPLPEIGTTARVKDSQSDAIPIDKKKIVDLIDTVSYKYLRENTRYTLLGKLMVRDEKGNVSEMMMNGKAVTAETPFTTEAGKEKSIFEKEGKVDVVFKDIDISGLEGKSLVVYEYLYLGDEINGDNEYEEHEDEDIFPVKHEDKDDENQTLHVIRIGTKAHGKDTASKEIENKGKVIIVDTVIYENVTPGETYTVEGTLYDKKTGEAIKVDGKEITGKATFKAEKASGETNVEFTFDIEKVNAKNIVVFESMFETGGRLVAEHKDLKDEDQTISVKQDVVETTEKETTETTTSEETALEDELKSSGKPKTGDSAISTVVLITFIISMIMIGILLYKMKNECSEEMEEGNNKKRE